MSRLTDETTFDLANHSLITRANLAL
ncbi:hypothetical protein BN2476_120029 [Paraburkholderia piptadeniae]|uniref:Uncharacterized protein n=1 Tax=Paraburkholderia piptadeniae TaxID=1701573 RepID=A0A1N7RR60_9BURK|nr:hypothetical protein BN2476_120029 [Paraburkholderia piptadeniae]